VDVSCAGRTDAGVHGRCQVVHFDTPAQRDMRGWVLGSCSNLPDSVAVLWAQPVADDFHARYAARSRRYRYRILNRPVRAALEARYVTWERLPLDAGRMHQAAQALLGLHDFSAFRALSCQAKHPHRTVLSVDVRRDGEYVTLEIEANGFLHHMVRNIVGSLLLVGRGERPVEWMAELLAGCDRQVAGPTGPASGLTFIGPRYEARWGLPPEVSQ
jgi:tRNA pseudouridine38-40 synthase